MTVIALMAVASICAGVIVDFQSSRSTAAAVSETGSRQYEKDVSTIVQANAGLASAMSQDPNIVSVLAKHDRADAGSQINSVVSKSGYPGDIALVDNNGKLLFSTDSPSFFDNNVRERNGLIDTALTSQQTVSGYASFDVQGVVTLSSASPVKSGGKLVGCVVTSQPLASDFLNGLVGKWAIDRPNMAGLGIAVVPNGAIGQKQNVTMTPNLQSQSGLINDLVNRGISGLPRPIMDLPITPITYCLPFQTAAGSFERDGKWWFRRDLPASGKEVAGVMLFGAPVAEIRSHAAAMVLFVIVLGAVVAFIALLLVRGLAQSVMQPMRILTYRAKELTNQKRALPPLEGLDGEWLELGDLIDTAVSNYREKLQSMRTQMNRQAEEFEERSRASQENTSHLNSLNRQIGQQAKQTAELSNQLNVANRQSILLQRKLDAVMQISTEAYLILDQYGNILAANPVFLNWLGATEAEIAGRVYFDLVKRVGEAPNDFAQGQAFARHGGDPAALINQFYPEGIVYNRIKNSGTEVLAHLQPVASDDQTIQAYIMVLRDKSLRSEISHLRNEIVAMLSESIRTPLVYAEGNWQTLLNNSRNMPPSLTEPLRSLHDHYADLIAVIDSLLMIYSDFVPPVAVPARQEVAINRIVADCLEEVSPIARDRQLALDYKSVTGLPNVTADKEILHGVLIQLLEKMIGITAAGGRVRVESVYKQSDIRIGVLSSGPALPEPEIQDMFVGFVDGKHNMDSYSERLAMYLARNNVERLGGVIWAESDRGTAIYFTIPL